VSWAAIHRNKAAGESPPFLYPHLNIGEHFQQVSVGIAEEQCAMSKGPVGGR
jgi:hypothetical protein